MSQTSKLKNSLILGFYSCKNISNRLKVGISKYGYPYIVAIQNYLNTISVFETYTTVL